MKKRSCIILAVILLILAAALGLGIHTLRSPEYALTKIFKDVEKSGIEGLYPHLTEDAKKTLDNISSVGQNKLISLIMNYLNKKDYIEMLKSEVKEIKWSLGDILKSKNKAAVILSFNYKDKLTGTVEMSMTRDKEGWKINGFKFPEFDTVDL